MLGLPEVLPRFDVIVHCREQDLTRIIERSLADAACCCHGWVKAPYAELRVPESSRHFWSPRLELTFDEDPKGTRVHGVFRPEPAVWTGFVFLHSVLAALACVGLSLGLSQWTLGQAPLAMLVLPLAVMLSLGLYFGALAGHRLGHEEMCMLRRELDRALGQKDPAGNDWIPTLDAELSGACRPKPSSSQLTP
ncbi:MAG: hypothetical protein KC457_30080 [Myxococcales bacterium]|nr:hypothetical protein [Myxococcales bacterium]